MAEYIDKSKLYKKIAESEEKARKTFLEASINDTFFDIYQEKMNELTALKHIVSDMESSDVAPVVHGQWVLKETVHIGLKEYMCSECAEDEYWEKYYCRGNEKHCPNCGAKMDL